MILCVIFAGASGWFHQESILKLVYCILWEDLVALKSPLIFVTSLKMKRFIFLPSF